MSAREDWGWLQEHRRPDSVERDDDCQVIAQESEDGSETTFIDRRAAQEVGRGRWLTVDSAIVVSRGEWR